MSFQSSINNVLGSVARFKAYKLARDVAAQKTANEQAEQLKAAKQQQQKNRRNFMRDYLAQQPTSLGGTVGELPKDVQKTIASQYDRAARRRMMDTMDKENKPNEQKQR